MYRAVVQVKGNPELLISCFQPEDKKIGERSAYTLKREKDGVTFEVQAKDSVALRAHLNSITKMFTVIEKMRTI